ncbi:MAG: phosphate ABC transporter permease subunit PstC [Proteobacteria bacterium]|jgi:phosphate ABC transporter, permease protein PstC|nr:MAG: phosphate ABC transporter permease subunit PstC [Pseudomonadota bacterium]
MLTHVFAALLVLTVIGFFIGRRRALASVNGQAYRLHSRPAYHASFVAAWVGIPASLLILTWIALQGPLLDRIVMATLPPSFVMEKTAGELSLVLSQIKSVAGGTAFGNPDPLILESGDRLRNWREIAQLSMFVSAIVLAMLGAVIAQSRISPEFRARQAVERILDGLMIACAVVAILTTLGIVLSLLLEAIRFFRWVSPLEFLLGLNWEPQIAMRADQASAGGAFGAIPVFLGTFLIALIAMAVAIPIGLLSAIYLTEYASNRFRAVIKPMLEILAGIPTVVYGFFAVLVVAPALRTFGEAVGIPIAPNSALAAGAVMGIMIIPFISSLSDDAINAVPRSMRDGSLALGATKGETIIRVLLPAALPGIMGGILLAVSRAIGETMIVVMAAGIIASLTLNPLQPVTTVTVQIVTLLIGDTEFDNPKTLAAFALGLMLFLSTLVLNIIAMRIVQRYREQYE